MSCGVTRMSGDIQFCCENGLKMSGTGVAYSRGQHTAPIGVWRISMRIKTWLVSTLGLALLLSVGCADNKGPQEDLDPRLLYQFDSCDDMLTYLKESFKEHSPIYQEGYYDWGVPEAGEDDWGETGGGTDGGEPSDGGNGNGNGGVDYSDTNVQVEGVDEPDLVKTDGSRIAALAQGTLHIVDATGDAPALSGSLPLGASYSAQMFLAGDRVFLLDNTSVYGYGWDEWGEPIPMGPDLQQWFGDDVWQVARIAEIDISNPADMKVVANLYVAADYLSARAIGETSRVVLRSRPNGMVFKSPYDVIAEWQGESQGGGDSGGGVDDGGEVEPLPVPPSDGGAEPVPDGGDVSADGVSFRGDNPWEDLWEQAVEVAREHNDQVIDESGPENWLPKYVYEDLSGGEPSYTEGLLLDCEGAMHPGTFSGHNLLSVLTLDLSSKLSLGHVVGIFSEGETVYSSRENLYVATHPWWSPWGNPVDELTSYIHKFELEPAKSEYVASGQVPGYLLSQWAMSEHDGDLRVASTDQDGWDTSTSHSMVTVLRQEGNDLEQVGQVDGLGQGEEIFAVRFMGDRGYIVTFRQIDPLYTLNLSDPTSPTVMGELKINGYSAYLHPVGENLLLGVGRDGDEEGAVFGTQLSLFDVSDLGNPVRLHATDLGSDWGSSEVEFDHKAFLYWQPTQTAVIPVNSYSFEEGEESYFSGALGYRIDAEQGFTLLGDVEHDDGNENPYWYGPGIRRSLVIGESLYTVSDFGLKASGLEGFEDQAWIAF